MRKLRVQTRRAFNALAILPTAAIFTLRVIFPEAEAIDPEWILSTAQQVVLLIGRIFKRRDDKHPPSKRP